MKQSFSDTPQERDLWADHALLAEIFVLHPSHLTVEELVVRMEDGPSGMDQVEIFDSLQSLRRSGLVRFNGEVVELTFAALRAAVIFECS